MAGSFTGGPCALGCPQLSRSWHSHVSIILLLVWLTSQRSNCQTSTLDVFVPCLPGYTFITVRGTVKEVIVPGYAGPALFLGHLRVLLIVCPDDVRLPNICATPQRGVIRDLLSCPQKSKAQLNKEPIHAPVDLLGSLIHSLRWTLLFAGTTNVLVKQSRRGASLSVLAWRGWKITSCRWEIICHTHPVYAILWRDTHVLQS